ncbi:MAG: hypothetical protein RLZZ301_773 [Bacteroidota bacterium]|jgi:hypothetical protein
MEKQFEIQHIWFNNNEANAVIVGNMKEEYLSYETKISLPMERLNHVINLLQRQNELEILDYMRRYEFGFVTEYQLSLGEDLNRVLGLHEMIGSFQNKVRKIVA